MNIGIDLDDTVNDLSSILLKYAKEYNKINNIEHTIKEYEWDFDKAFGWTDNNAREFLSTYIIEVFNKAKPKEGAKEIINKLKADGHRIVIITARDEDSADDLYYHSDRWLRKNNIMYDKLVINSHDKAEKCKENKIDIFVDDGIRHCENVYEKLNIPVYIFDSEYNKKYESRDIKRIYSWEEFYEEIKKNQK